MKGPATTHGAAVMGPCEVGGRNGGFSKEWGGLESGMEKLSPWNEFSVPKPTLRAHLLVCPNYLWRSIIQSRFGSSK